MKTYRMVKAVRFYRTPSAVVRLQVGGREERRRKIADLQGEKEGIGVGRVSLGGYHEMTVPVGLFSQQKIPVLASSGKCSLKKKK